STKKGPKTVDSVQPAGLVLLCAVTSIDRPSVSDNRMNSWRLSSVMWPTSVRNLIASNHSSSVSLTSRANECRCCTRLVMMVRSRLSPQPSIEASTAWVIVSSLMLRMLLVSLLASCQIYPSLCHYDSSLTSAPAFLDDSKSASISVLMLSAWVAGMTEGAPVRTELLNAASSRSKKTALPISASSGE